MTTVETLGFGRRCFACGNGFVAVTKADRVCCDCVEKEKELGGNDYDLDYDDEPLLEVSGKPVFNPSDSLLSLIEKGKKGAVDEVVSAGEQGAVVRLT